MSETCHDLFVSYRRADQAAIEVLIAGLERHGVTCWRDTRDIEDFGSVQQAINTGLAHCRALLVWYSVAYPQSRACQWELTTGYCAAQAGGDPRQRLLVVNPAADSGHIHLPELFDQQYLVAPPSGDPAAVDDLALRIRDRLARHTPTTPLGTLRALTPPTWYPAMALGSTRFVGRLPQMWRLHGLLGAGDAAMLTGSGGKPGVAQVRGVGGVGKSLLAEEYALRFGAAYPGGVFWLRAYGHADGGQEKTVVQRRTDRDLQVLDFATRLGLDTAGLTQVQVVGWLQAHFKRDGRPFLWVVDDLPSDLGGEVLSAWSAPHPLGRTLFTSRSRRDNHTGVVELSQLEPDDALWLLTRGQPLCMQDEADAREICHQLGGHALAIDVAAALVARRGHGAFLRSLGQPSRDVLDTAAEFKESLPNGHARSITATLLASVGQLDEPARDLLRLASVLAAVPIPRELQWRCLGAVNGWTDDDEAQDAADLAADQLLGSSLAEQAEAGAIEVHTLVMRTIRRHDEQPGRIEQMCAAAVKVVLQVMPEVVDVRQHEALADWVAHARQLGQVPQETATASLRGWVGRYDLEVGHYAQARISFEMEVEILQRVLGDAHADTLTAMGNLALTLGAQGDLAEARRWQESALNTMRRVLGEEHPDTLISVVNLGETIRAQGNLVDARCRQEAVLKTLGRVLGEEHPHTVASMNNLALTLGAQGDLAGARRLQEAGLATLQRVLGKEHPDTLMLMIMSNLAGTLWAQGELAEARHWQEMVLDTRRRVLGNEHPDTLTSMNNLALTLGSQGDLMGARQLQEAGLGTMHRVLGKAHPTTLMATSNFTSTLLVLGDLMGAKHRLEEVLETMRSVLGEQHPSTLMIMSNLAETLRAQGDLVKARGWQETVLEARLQILGEDHPDTLASMNNLANTLSSQGDLAGARRLQEAGLQSLRRVLGTKHPSTLMLMSNLASTLWTQGEWAQARRWQDEVLEMRRCLLGDAHPDTLTSMNNHAEMLRDQGDLAGARHWQERVLETKGQFLDRKNSDVSVTAWNLLNTLIKLADHESAQQVFTEYLVWLFEEEPRILSANQRQIATMLGKMVPPATDNATDNLTETLTETPR